VFTAEPPAGAGSAGLAPLAQPSPRAPAVEGPTDGYEVTVDFGRVLALHHPSPTSHKTFEEIRRLSF
jgi:hypothetical protein